MDAPKYFAPDSTHPALKTLLFTLLAVGLLSGFFYQFFYPLFALSRADLFDGHVWQLLTYPFDLGEQLSWGPLLVLSIELFLLWTYGSLYIERRGIRSFYALFFGAAAFAGLSSMLLLNTNQTLSGPSPCVFALLLSWVSLNPHAEIWLFGVQMKLQRAVLGLLTLDLLIHLSQASWAPLVAHASGALFGLFFCKLPSLTRARAKIYRKSKVFDIKSGRPVLDDAAFMDAMLARISQFGERSLTAEEKRRMQQISKNQPTS